MRGIHVHAACCWYREGTLLVPVAKAGRVVLVVPETARVAAGRTGGSCLYARVSWHDQRSGLGRRVARLSSCVAGAGLSVARVEAEATSEADWSRAKVRRLVSDPAVTVVVAGDPGRPGGRTPNWQRLPCPRTIAAWCYPATPKSPATWWAAW